MNEFEWLKQTRELNHPVAPQSDLWPGIAERIRTPVRPARTRHSRLLPWAAAASLAAFSVFAGWVAWTQQVTPTPTPQMAMRALPTTVTPWKPRDPRLAGAAIELNVARRELVRAIHRAPRETYLQHMLLNTNQQLDRLQQLEHRAG